MSLTHVFATMGTMASVVQRGRAIDPEILADLESEFAEWNARYSLYRPDSELSRVASGQLNMMDASARLRETYALALDWRAATGGAFTANRPDGVIDLSGVVKALAMSRAAELLVARGAEGWGINVGGDVVISGDSTWTIGIVDPADRGEFITSLVLSGSRRACATSGIAERGDHIWSVNSATEFVQATVLADDIVTADVLATAIIAGGSETLDLVCRAHPIDVVTVDTAGEVRMTPGAVRAMRAAAENELIR
jgi:thiamine biosynthesis lipoprotein